MKLDRTLAARLTNAGQGFLVEYCEQLDDDQAGDLATQLAGLDLELVAQLREHATKAPTPGHQIEPPEYVSLADRAGGADAGADELRAGRVAFVMFAGGQASRLLWDGPKGSFSIGPVSGRSLFQVLVERIVRAGADFGTVPRLAITTSATTDAAIRAFFERQDCFGMPRDRLAFAQQASLPALDDDGHFLLAGPAKVFTSPDGHGGAMQGVARAGLLEAWAGLGVTTVCTFQVDNPLLPVVDPYFIGLRRERGVPIVTKVVPKRAPDERLGVVVLAEGRPSIIEYSELPEALARHRDPDGRLTFRLGSIAVHAFDIDFLRDELATDLPLHVAQRTIPCLGPDGTRGRRPGRKFERFIFDLFPRASGIIAVEVTREREYAPVKHPEGEDSPGTARAGLDAEYRRWFREAGVEPPEGAFVELSPLDAVGPSDLEDPGGTPDSGTP